MVKLNKTREILLDYQKSNWESKTGRPITDKTWRDVSNELSKLIMKNMQVEVMTLMKKLNQLVLTN